MENQSTRRAVDLVILGVLALSGVLAIVVLFSYGLPPASELRTQVADPVYPPIRPFPPVPTVEVFPGGITGYDQQQLSPTPTP